MLITGKVMCEDVVVLLHLLIMMDSLAKCKPNCPIAAAVRWSVGILLTSVPPTGPSSLLLQPLLAERALVV